jgi:uncharacterized membrane protein
MLLGLAWVVLFLLAPPVLQWLAQHTRVFRWLGVVVAAYLVGIALGNLKAYGLPEWAPPAQFIEPLTGLCIFFAIPLFLLTADFRQWLRARNGEVRGFWAACLVPSLMGLLAVGLLPQLPDGWRASGMLVGAATGGTVNLAAVGYVLGTPPETIVVVNTADIAVGAVYLVFILRFARPLLLRWLPEHATLATDEETDSPAVPHAWVAWPKWRQRLVVFGLSAAIVGTSLGLASAIQALLVGSLPTGLVKELLLPVTCLLLSPLAVVASLHCGVRSLKVAEGMADYGILVFSVAFGSRVDVTALQLENAWLFVLAVLIVWGGTLVFFAVARPLRIDRDTAIMLNAATILSVPFVGTVAEALNNRRVVLTGIAAGIAGYATGTFFGLLVAYAARWLGG